MRVFLNLYFLYSYSASFFSFFFYFLKKNFLLFLFFILLQHEDDVDDDDDHHHYVDQAILCSLPSIAQWPLMPLYLGCKNSRHTMMSTLQRLKIPLAPYHRILIRT